MFQFLKFHDVFTCEVVCLSCFIIQQKIFASCLKSYKVELWKGVRFSEDKLNHKVLRFGSNYSKLRTHVKDNSNNKVKSVVKIHLCDDFDILFWCCRVMNS